jgi:amino acid adenylation domain-containing protein
MDSTAVKYPRGLSEFDIGAFSLVDLVRARSLEHPEKLAYTFLSEGDASEASMTYAQLDRRARAIAAVLQNLVGAGRNTLLLYPPGLEFHAGFFGCLYAGVVAVPAYPARNSRGLPRLQAIVKDAQPTVVLTTSHLFSMAKLFFAQAPDLEALTWLATDTMDTGLEHDWRQLNVSGDALAFLQYTSGSTGTPKGVMLTHRNLLHNASTVFNAVEHTPEDKYVSWLPTFHDMGFMAGVLQPLYAGIPAVLMSPISFLQRPIQWLQAISEHKGTTSGAPNFAYDLCVRKTTPEQRAALDLSSWSVAFNGAEPIHAETLDKFVAAFEPCGFRREAFFPCYGLAEATLIVSGVPKSMRPTIKEFQSKALQNDQVIQAREDQKDAQPFVGCGGVLGRQQVAIVETESFTRCPRGRVGEIWVAGPSVAQGYWNRTEETEQIFHAFISDTNEGPFLRTGDLGFLQDGELFITGRLKDLVIIRGRNHYPQDIELSVERCHLALRPGCGAAFSIDVAGEERLVIVQEIDDRYQPDEINTIIRSICQTVAEDHELQVEALALIKAGTIPKTSSGKIQRSASKKMFLKKAHAVVAEWQVSAASETEVGATDLQSLLQSAGGIESWLVSQVAAKMRIHASEIAIDKPLTQYGVDSLTDIELVHSIEAKLGISLPVLSFLQGFTLAEILSQIHAKLGNPSSDAELALLPATDSLSTYPLSLGQQAIFFLHQLAPESTAYNSVSAVRIRSAVDAAALHRAFQALVDRHPSLRTTFDASDRGPLQRVHPHSPVCFTQEDASSWSDDRLNSRLAQEARSPFDLQNGPVLRLNLFTRSRNDHVLFLAVHHIVADLWSLAVLIDELGVLYQAESLGMRPSLPSPTVQYTDYIRWQSAMLTSSQGERLRSYWQDRLTGQLPVINLSTDRPRPLAQSFRGASRSLMLDDRLAAGLKAIARENDATLYAVLLTAFNVLLHRYTGQEDILVGCPTSGRGQARLERVVGYFVNPVVVRADLSGASTFRQLLVRSRQTILAAFEHQDYPFALLVELLQPERDPSRSPLFQVMFVLQKMPLLDEQQLGAFAIGEEGARMELGGLSLECMRLEQEVAQFDLTLMMAETDRGLGASLQYNADLFDPETIQRMLAHFEVLLNGVVNSPLQSVSSLPLLTRQEHQQLVFEWNDTAAAYPAGRCIHELIEAQVERTPDTTAVVFGKERLSYRELNNLSNKLARHLRRLGAGPEVRIGICLERSLDLVAGLLAILKSGGAYVPLDPYYPRERLGFVLEDAQVPILLTQRKLVASLPEQVSELVCIEDVWEMPDRQGRENPSSQVSANNLGYLIYTSGSTGKPKGVAIEHHSAVTLMHWAKEVFAPEDLSGVLASTSICFDLSVFELFVPLSVGGKVIIAENALEVATLPTAHEVTLINTVPSAIAELVRLKAIPDSVRVVNLAGEPLLNSLVQQVYEQEKIHSVYNLYGPSEDTTYSTYAMVKRGAEGPASIGRPVSNSQVYLLDGQLQPVPVGIAGEIYIGGEGLARGYLNRAELTAERFVPDPFASRNGGRLYRTGDLGRYQRDGEIEFLGRVDHQVKVRGFRIELGEIEEFLLQHPAVKETVVVAREEKPGEKHVVAYVVASLHEELKASELRGYLRGRLPEYMVPGVFVKLEQMPRTPNGKIDRQRLPAPRRSDAEAEAGQVAPRNAAEEIIAGIWKEVLQINEVGVKDNFFEMGGTSLVAAQVISRMRKAFNLDLALRAIFELPTVEALSERVEGSLGGQRRKVDVTIERAPRGDGLPLSFAQHRLWFIDQFESGSYAYNMPGALKLSGRLDIGALDQSLNEIIRRHEVLRTTFDVTDGRPDQIIAEGFKLELALADISLLPEADRDSYVLETGNREARTPFDLANGPLVRARLLRLDEETHILFVTMHHIISDGWSLNIFLKELLALYEAFSNERPSPLPEMPIQYADFTLWQRQWLRGEVLEDLLLYWKKQLGGELSALQLPTDRPRLAAANLEAAKQTITIPKSVAEDLRSLSIREGATRFMTLLAAFKVLLYRYSGQEDLIVGTPIANRNRAEIENLIGLFVNTLILRTDLQGRPSFRALLGRVREVAMDGYAHQDLPFEKLVEELQPDRDLTRNPLFQVMMDLQDAPLPAFEVSGLSISTMQVGAMTTKYIDLVLHVVDSAEGLITSLEYSTDLFEAATIGRMLGHFQTILSAVIANPDERISELPLLTEGERHEIVVEWNDSRADYPLEICVHQVIEAAAEESPHAVAVVFEQKQLTYGELNRRSNQLAHYLRRQNVGVETLVGVLMEHSVELIVGMLAIMKAGGAYVALDPEYPAERLASMLENAHAPVLLTQRRLLNRLPETDAEVICADRLWREIAQESEANPVSGVAADNIAIVLYTSGSTGKPKGVMMTHRGTCNHIFWAQDNFPLAETDSMPFKYSVCFDASVFEILYPLFAKARLVIVPQSLHKDVASLVNFISRNKITTIDIPTPMLPVLMEDSNFLKCESLRQITCASDSMSVEVKERYFAAVGKPLVHFYGPCEASIGSTFNICRPGGESTIVSVGKPVANTQIYTLDPTLQPMPVGLTGEIYVGGVGVTRGYLNKPDVTAERFIPDPFSQEPGARIYKTGDRGRYRPDGNLEFAGRMDHQVKIRGYRIELGDVEAAIMECPVVEETIVLARHLDDGRPSHARNGKALTAYVVFKEDEPGQVAELRKYLAKKLPSYMVPSVFVPLAEMPWNSSGKIDVMALPEPAQAAFELEADFILPRNAVEQVLAMIWTEILEVDPISIHNNFFELGGHSLAAAQVIYRVRDLFHVELPVRTLFEGATLAELSQSLTNNETKRGRTEKIAQAYIMIKTMSPDEIQQALLERKKATG